MKSTSRSVVALFTVLTFFLASCGGSTTESSLTEESSGETASSDQTAAAGIRLVSASDGADIIDNPPEDLVILDVRTPEEFNAGHIDGAIMIDFYEADFGEQIAALDPDVPYVIYCNSGNRSGQTTLIMNELGFGDVADVDGGIQAWNTAGLPTVTP